MSEATTLEGGKIKISVRGPDPHTFGVYYWTPDQFRAIAQAGVHLLAKGDE